MSRVDLNIVDYLNAIARQQIVVCSPCSTFRSFFKTSSANLTRYAFDKGANHINHPFYDYFRQDCILIYR